MVGGESVSAEVVSAVMTAVPTLVALGAAINWKEEITSWLKQMKAKYAKLIWNIQFLFVYSMV